VFASSQKAEHTASVLIARRLPENFLAKSDDGISAQNDFAGSRSGCPGLLFREALNKFARRFTGTAILWDRRRPDCVGNSGCEKQLMTARRPGGKNQHSFRR
jgi:hypothetical protein